MLKFSWETLFDGLLTYWVDVRTEVCISTVSSVFQSSHGRKAERKCLGWVRILAEDYGKHVLDNFEGTLRQQPS